MGDGRAEGRLAPRALDIDVDPLVIACDPREGVDVLLADGSPGRRSALDADRLALGLFEIHSFWFDLPVLLEELRARFQALDERHAIEMRAPKHLAILADRDRIDQMLSNVLSNAIRYSADGGSIRLTAEQTGDGVHITVQDNGAGVAREYQQVIFEPFGRARGALPGGLGLGLTISKGIIGQHGGQIRVESDGVPGQGSTFHITLPLPTRRG